MPPSAPKSPISGPGSSEDIAPGIRVPSSVLRFTFDRSGGPGGQNVNKVATRALLRVSLADLAEVPSVTGPVLRRLRGLAGRRITTDNELIITSSRHRTQKRNRQDCLERLRALLVSALAEPKKRRPTRPTRASVRARLEAKRRQGEKKQSRRRPSPDST